MPSDCLCRPTLSTMRSDNTSLWTPNSWSAENHCHASVTSACKHSVPPSLVGPALSPPPGTFISPTPRSRTGHVGSIPHAVSVPAIVSTSEAPLVCPWTEVAPPTSALLPAWGPIVPPGIGPWCRLPGATVTTPPRSSTPTATTTQVSASVNHVTGHVLGRLELKFTAIIHLWITITAKPLSHVDYNTRIGRPE